jgi:myo-inositol-1(or 4)-monophosphatase
VALWHKGAIQAGVVHLPCTDETFTAARGQGAWCNKEPIRVSSAASLEQSLVATGFPYDVPEQVERIISPLRRVLCACRGVRRMGAAAIDLAYTACGRFDGFYERDLKPWDTAAGWLLVEEAGGRVSRFDPVAAYDIRADTVLASNGAIHAELGALLEEPTPTS